MPDEKQDLFDALDEAGIEYDRRWGVDRLRAALEAEAEGEEPEAEVDQDPTPEPAPRPDTVLVRVLRDYWPAEDERVRKGTLQEMTALEALDGIEAGTLERVKS